MFVLVALIFLRVRVSSFTFTHLYVELTLLLLECSIFEYCPAGSSAHRQWTILAVEVHN